MLVSEGRAAQAWRKKERTFHLAGLEDDDRIAACVVLNCAFNAIGEEPEGGEAMECAGGQIAAEAFVNGNEDSNRIERVAAEVSEAVVVRDVRTTQDALPDIPQNLDRLTGS